MGLDRLTWGDFPRYRFLDPPHPHPPLQKTTKLKITRYKKIAFEFHLDSGVHGALKPGSVAALLPGNLLSHRQFEVESGNNSENVLSSQSVVTFLLLF